MKRSTQLLLLGVLLTSTVASHADLTSAWWRDSGTGALVCNTNLTGWSSGNGDLTMYGNQFWGPGNLTGQFNADSAADPRATKTYYLDNSTGQTWVGYQVAAYMDTAFSISNIVSSVPGNWSFSVTQPVLNSSPLYYGSSEYVGYINFYSGTPISNGQELDFAYDVGFSGSTTYRFEDTLTPVVPEPTALSLVGLGALLLSSVSRAARSRR